MLHDVLCIALPITVVLPNPKAMVFSAAGGFHNWSVACILYLLGISCVVILTRYVLKACEYAGEVCLNLRRAFLVLIEVGWRRWLAPQEKLFAFEA